MTEASDPSDVARLREELDLSRRELAAVRARLEQALEDLAVERDRQDVTELSPRPAVLGRLADRLRRQAP